jgi:hypothetical protein
MSEPDWHEYAEAVRAVAIAGAAERGRQDGLAAKRENSAAEAAAMLSRATERRDLLESRADHLDQYAAAVLAKGKVSGKGAQAELTAAPVGTPDDALDAIDRLAAELGIAGEQLRKTRERRRAVYSRLYDLVFWVLVPLLAGVVVAGVQGTGWEALAVWLLAVFSILAVRRYGAGPVLRRLTGLAFSAGLAALAILTNPVFSWFILAVVALGLGAWYRGAKDPPPPRKESGPR